MTSWYQSGYDMYRREPTHGGFRMERVFSVEEIPDPVRAPPPTENGVAASGGGGADVGGGSAGSGVGAMNWCPSEWYEEFRARQQILVRQMEVTAQMVARLNVGIAVEFDRDEEDSSAQSGHAPTRCSAGGSQESEGGIGLDFGSNEEHADEVIDEWPHQDVVWDEEYTLCVSDPSEPQDSHGNIEAIHKSRSQSKKQRSRDGQQDVRAGGAALAGHSGRRVQCRRHCQRQLDGRGHAHLRPQRARHDRHRRRRQGVARRLRVRGRQARDSNAGSTKRRSVRRSLNKALDIWPPSSSDKPRDSVEAILMVFDSLRRRMLQLDEKEGRTRKNSKKAV